MPIERCLACGAIAWAAVDITKSKRIALCRDCIRQLDDGRDVTVRNVKTPDALGK